MIYKNFEIYNAAELINENDGSVSWIRVPSDVYTTMEKEFAPLAAPDATGVELRFVLKGDKATIRMRTYDDEPKTEGRFHVYRGGIQGIWSDHEVHRHITGRTEEFVIEKANNLQRLKVMSQNSGHSWDPEVVRIIFDYGRIKIYDIEGDIEPPKKEQLPPKTLLAYGSSITHGSNSIDMSHSWVSVLAHNLRMDVRNLGMAGSCAMEPAMAEYIASEGEKGNWDIATMELGINVLDWEEEKFRSRVENIINCVAGRNPDKEIFVVSPFYYCGEDFDKDTKPKLWREIVEETITKLNFSNVTYINGLDVLGDMSYMSADEVHPNIYGMQKIADDITKIIKSKI